MRIETQNRLAHLQVEYDSLCNQTTMLNNQASQYSVQVNALNAYVRTNPGDRKAVSDLREVSRKYNSLLSQIRRNRVRAGKLSTQINLEMQRQQQRAMGVRR